ncbi:hypothetical protein HAX54_017066 [Datura stramonium]|uniref:Uncharacterized protein n=1 Tax=Datura stramonium TaxID=4076 RepID=A0ABS8UMW3_DATST|nr:hypothetical protein [Datura stramonium]
MVNTPSSCQCGAKLRRHSKCRRKKSMKYEIFSVMNEKGKAIQNCPSSKETGERKGQLLGEEYTEDIEVLDDYDTTWELHAKTMRWAKGDSDFRHAESRKGSKTAEIDRRRAIDNHGSTSADPSG